MILDFDGTPLVTLTPDDCKEILRVMLVQKLSDFLYTPEVIRWMDEHE